MTLGRREYSEADMIRMQRDAEERVREMQSRARQAVDDAEVGNHSAQSRNRNWNTGSGMRRPPRRGQRPEPAPEREEAPKKPPPPPEEAQKRTTIIEDVMGALSLDEDYLLIIGLLLILINQRADTTLILALAYLLI